MLFIHRNRLSKTVAIFTLIFVLASVLGAKSGAGDAGGPDVDVDGDVNFSSACNTDSDCTATVRSRSPQQIHEGVKICKCYASSSITPFDECEGQADTCMSARCGNSCIGMLAYCSASFNCELRYYDVEKE